MNETMSLLLATTVLAISGLGLYMYKSEDGDQIGGDDYAEEDEFNSDNEIVEDHDDYDNDDDIDYYAPKVRSRAGKSKTKRNKKGGGTKRKY